MGVRQALNLFRASADRAAGEIEASSFDYDDAVGLLSFAQSKALMKVIESTEFAGARSGFMGLIERLADSLMEAFDLG
jgi:hypothetical protein